MEKALHNRLEPNVDIKHERIQHRKMAWMIAKGLTQREVAKEMGYTEGWVSQVCRQPWFTEMVVEELSRVGRNVVEEIFKNAAPGSALKLIELRDNAESESVQLSATKELLDRYLGKAPQTVLHGDAEAVDDPKEEYERLEREARRLRGETV